MELNRDLRSFLRSKCFGGSTQWNIFARVRERRTDGALGTAGGEVAR